MNMKNRNQTVLGEALIWIVYIDNEFGLFILIMKKKKKIE